MVFNRMTQPSTMGRQVSRTERFQAPFRGWIRNEALSQPKPGGAEVLTNWFPTPEGCRMRRGSSKHASMGDEATYLTVYRSGSIEKLFGATPTDIYDVSSPADPDTPPSAAVSGKTSGYWSSVQFATTGGDFLVMVNGADDMEQFDGSSWLTVNATSSPRAITGVDTADISHVWKFKNYLFMVKSGTMDAYYLPVGTVAGAATLFTLGGVFHLGGELLYGATWSIDSGDGIDDYCVFITTEGEVAVYQGTNPATAADFALVGVYRIGRPLGKNAWFKAGGDIAILTDDGIVPMSSVMKLDRSGLKKVAITYPIEEAWRQIVNERDTGVRPFTCVLWQSETMLVIGIPASGGQEKVTFVANARTGAWAPYVGWDIRCLAIFDDKLFFGTRDGSVVRGEITGADRGAPYTATVVPKFVSFGSPAEKSALAARVIARANNAFTPQLFANADYEVDIPIGLDADPDGDGNLWDVGIWNQSTWGGSAMAKRRQSEWQTVLASGQALAPGLSITSGRTAAPDVELIELDLQFEVGEVMA